MTLSRISVEQFIAIRLLSAKVEGETKAGVKKPLDAFFHHRLSKSAWRDCFEQTLASMVQAGVVEQLGKARYQLTAIGVRQNQDFFGYSPKNTQWQSLKNIDLIANILQLPMPSAQERKRLSLADGLRGAIIRQHYALPIADYPTLIQTRDALLWRDAFVSERVNERLHQAKQKIGSRFTLTAVIALLLRDILQTEQTLEPKNAVNQLVAKIVGAQRTDANELRLALIRRALSAAPAQPLDESAFALDAFAAQVTAAVQTCATGHFGDDKVFISHVYAHMARDYALTVTLAQFKQHLANANNQRLLSLAQADLIPAMNQQDVLESELCYLTGVFHFIRR